MPGEVEQKNEPQTFHARSSGSDTPMGGWKGQRGCVIKNKIERTLGAVGLGDGWWAAMPALAAYRGVL